MEEWRDGATERRRDGGTEGRILEAWKLLIFDSLKNFFFSFSSKANVPQKLFSGVIQRFHGYPDLNLTYFFESTAAQLN